MLTSSLDNLTEYIYSKQLLDFCCFSYVQAFSYLEKTLLMLSAWHRPVQVRSKLMPLTIVRSEELDAITVDLPQAASSFSYPHNSTFLLPQFLVVPAVFKAQAPQEQCLVSAVLCCISSSTVEHGRWLAQKHLLNRQILFYFVSLRHNWER